MVTDEMVEKARSAVILGEDADGKPVYLSEAEARAALEAALSAAEPVACEYGHDNGDGTDSPTYVRWPLSPHVKPHGDMPVKLFYAAPPAPSVAVKDLPTAIASMERHLTEAIEEHGASPRFSWLEKDIRDIRSALSAQVQDVAGLERLRDVTYAVQHNPNCSNPYLVRLVGKSGSIDFKNYGQAFSMVKHETGDILGFGKNLDEAIDNALAAAAPAKQEGGADE